ncbi:MAG TPA: glutamate racemase [Chitinophagales bacterium]|nr:glutamate racemase [Chitinophagales bacterium]
MKSSARKPIGIFDSGIGGLTVAHRIIRDFPDEDIVYFGDTAHLPYGDKSEELIRQYSLRISEFLIEKGCKLIVIACNTASSVAHDELVNSFGSGTYFVNVVDPAINGITAMADVSEVGIIGTQRTIGSDVYSLRIHRLKPEMQVRSLATPLLAPMIEAGFFNNKISRTVIEAYLNDPSLKSIQALILACTHYPLIKKQIHEFYRGYVRVFDSTDFISKEVGMILDLHGLRNDKKSMKNQFYVSDLTESFEKTTRLFFREEIVLEYYPLWEASKSLSL